MEKYNILIKILDNIRLEAPEEFSSYHPSDTDENKLNQARSKSFIHLFLKVKFGLTNFRERHDFITDETGDGGIDAYFIDKEAKIFYLIQSKFRNNAINFEEKKITADELVTMEVDSILKGKLEDSRGVSFNEKIKNMQSAWREIGDKANYKFKIIILGNLKEYTEGQIKKLMNGIDYEVFDFDKTYNDLVYPLCSGTYYDPKEIKVTIDLFEKEQATLKQSVKTKYGDYKVRLVFVPAKEIARIMLKYKNSLLKYNPRNYLDISKNPVNAKIKKTIIDTNTNDFAILNNGITMLARSFEITERTGTINIGQAIITSPQIINGGQTAYTLSNIYKENISNINQIFKNKEVMLKVIVLRENDEPSLDFIEEISNATNQQTSVDEADRRSNEKVQILLQDRIFKEFGLFYERKRGEFYNGISEGYIDKKQVIPRDKFLRAIYSFKGKPADGRSKGKDSLFKTEVFTEILPNLEEFSKMIYAYNILKKLYELGKEDKKRWGSGIKYGKMAIIAAAGIINPNPSFSKEKLDLYVTDMISKLQEIWLDFEKYAKDSFENKDYFEDIQDFDNYYKGKTLNRDINSFFSKIKYNQPNL